jgi:hypothetical protein
MVGPCLSAELEFYGCNRCARSGCRRADGA